MRLPALAPDVHVASASWCSPSFSWASVRRATAKSRRGPENAEAASPWPITSSTPRASQPTAPSAFFRVGTESICLRLADLAVDAPGSSRYSSARPGEALTDFVGTIMAIVPSDPRAAELRQVLVEHLAAATAAGASASEALKSTFTLACASPSSVLVGL